MVVNKVLGRTPDNAGVYLSKDVFGVGQLYVGFSRCKDRGNQAVLVEHDVIVGKP
ncbi:hypothetical protein BGZ51_007283, partial [Haplosporangium sp. Z 767]